MTRRPRLGSATLLAVVIGLDEIAAARDAAQKRLRPVLMTSAAMVFGSLSLVLVSGPGAAARNSIGTILVAGMIIGTLFTLFVVPVFYALIAVERGTQDAAAARAEPASLAAAAAT
jgi:multidrug efflux pump